VTTRVGSAATKRCGLGAPGLRARLGRLHKAATITGDGIGKTAARMANDSTGKPDLSSVATSDMLARVGRAADGAQLSIGDLADGLGERSFGLLLLVLALFAWIPVLPPGVPSIFGFAIVLLAGQLIAGRTSPWLPGWIRRRGVKRASFVALIERAGPYLKRVERVTRPRLRFMTGAAAERAIAVYIVLLALLICIPLPMTNAFPALAVAVLAVAFIQQDGLLAMVGITMGLAAVAIMIAFWGGAYLGIVWAVERGTIGP